MAEQPSSFADARGARLREQARESRDHDLLSALVAIEGGLRALQADVATVRLHQALRNVLDNARRHAPGAPVRISAGLDGDAIAIRISDGGPGIPLDVLPTVTSRGVQAPGARAGSGLGLHVVSELVAEAGGTFSIESDHHGTTVVVHVPAAASTTPTASTRPSGTGAGR